MPFLLLLLRSSIVMIRCLLFSSSTRGKNFFCRCTDCIPPLFISCDDISFMMNVHCSLTNYFHNPTHFPSRFKCENINLKKNIMYWWCYRFHNASTFVSFGMPIPSYIYCDHHAAQVVFKF